MFSWESFRNSSSKLKMDFPCIYYLYGWQIAWRSRALAGPGSSFQPFSSTVKKNCNSEVTYRCLWNLIWPLITSFIRAGGTPARDHMLWQRERVTLILFSNRRGLGVGWRKAENSHFLATWVHLQVRKRNKISGGWSHQLQWMWCEQSWLRPKENLEGIGCIHIVYIC